MAQRVRVKIIAGTDPLLVTHQTNEALDAMPMGYDQETTWVDITHAMTTIPWGGVKEQVMHTVFLQWTEVVPEDGGPDGR